MTWRATDPQGNEGGKIAWEIVRYTRGRGLDIGCGPNKVFPHFIGVDNKVDTQLFGVQMNPDVVIPDASNMSLFGSKTMDFIFSSHLLEHIAPEKVAATLAEWWRLIKVDGYLVLYLPDEDEYPKMGEPGANPDHKWNVSFDRVIEYMDGIPGWDLVDFQKRNQDMEYSLYFVFQRKGAREHLFSYRNPRPEKTAAVVRYGAYGDLLQASSVTAGLKAEGYHVTLFCSTPGYPVVQHDPSVDEFYLQDVDQVPNQFLGSFWNAHKPKYQRWVNLCESVEGTFLAMPGRTIHEWPPAVRHDMLNRNYVEMSHLIARIPHNPNPRFYPTPDELAWARKERAKMAGAKVLLWSLAGSSVHKTWAGLDSVIATIMLNYPEWDVVLAGGETCVMLEAGWENEARVYRRSGVWDIRQTMTFLRFCDCIVGPETGVMNAASMLDVPKVTFLSHSTEENLTRDWVNNISLWSRETSCPGRGENEAPACHQMHYGWQNCRRTENGVAQCQEDISVEQAWHAIEHAMNYSSKLREAR